MKEKIFKEGIVKLLFTMLLAMALVLVGMPAIEARAEGDFGPYTGETEIGGVTITVTGNWYNYDPYWFCCDVYNYGLGIDTETPELWVYGSSNVGFTDKNAKTYTCPNGCGATVSWGNSTQEVTTVTLTSYPTHYSKDNDEYIILNADGSKASISDFVISSDDADKYEVVEFLYDTRYNLIAAHCRPKSGYVFSNSYKNNIDNNNRYWTAYSGSKLYVIDKSVVNSSNYKIFNDVQVGDIVFGWKATLKKITPTADDFVVDTKEGTVTAAEGKDLGTITVYYYVDREWTTTKPTKYGSYSMGIETTGNDKYEAIGTELTKFSDISWKYMLVKGEKPDTSAWPISVAHDGCTNSDSMIHMYLNGETFEWGDSFAVIGRVFVNGEYDDCYPGVETPYPIEYFENSSVTAGWYYFNETDRKFEPCLPAEKLVPDAIIKEEVAVPETNEIINITPVIENNDFNAVLGDSSIKEAIALSESENNSGVWVWAEVKDVTDGVDASDANVMKENVKNATIGAYIDINLFKQVAGQDKSQITETATPLTFTITVPASLVKKDREFAVARVHDGKYEQITEFVKADADGKVTFATDKFSTYALIYKDAAPAPVTGDTTPILLYIILMAMAGTVIIVTFKKTKAVR